MSFVEAIAGVVVALGTVGGALVAYRVWRDGRKAQLTATMTGHSTRPDGLSFAIAIQNSGRAAATNVVAHLLQNHQLQLDSRKAGTIDRGSTTSVELKQSQDDIPGDSLQKGQVLVEWRDENGAGSTEFDLDGLWVRAHNLRAIRVPPGFLHE